MSLWSCLPRSPTRRQRGDCIYHDDIGFPYDDETKMVEYSVINRQTLLRQCCGISQLRFTLGLNELHDVERAQGAAQRAGKPHMVRLDKDLSGQQVLHLYLWRQYELKSMEAEHEVDIVTDMQVCRRPVGGKLKQESRMHALRDKGVTVVPHADRKFAVELQLKYHSTHVTKPIKDVEASRNKEEEMELVKTGYVKAQWNVAGDWQEGLGRFGGVFGQVHLWVLKGDPRKPYAMKRAQGISKSAEYNDKVAPHYNDELQRVMEFLILSENDVHLVSLHTRSRFYSHEFISIRKSSKRCNKPRPTSSPPTCAHNSSHLPALLPTMPLVSLQLWRLFKRMDTMNEDAVWIDSLLDFMGQHYLLGEGG
jgi:hypothetical protein